MRKLSIFLALTVLAADVLTKWWVQSARWLQNYPVVPEFLTIRYAENTGIAFGLLDDVRSPWKGPLLSAVAVLALGMVLYYIWTTPVGERAVLLALGLVMGGILGNFLDRLVRGYVVDFIRVHWREVVAWPTFNVADSAITTGVLLILVTGLTAGHDSKAAERTPLSE